MGDKRLNESCKGWQNGNPTSAPHQRICMSSCKRIPLSKIQKSPTACSFDLPTHGTLQMSSAIVKVRCYVQLLLKTAKYIVSMFLLYCLEYITSFNVRNNKGDAYKNTSLCFWNLICLCLWKSSSSLLSHARNVVPISRDF